MNYDLSPQQNPWRDSIGNVVKRLRGYEYTITPSPGSLDFLVRHHVPYRKVETRYDQGSVLTIEMKYRFWRTASLFSLLLLLGPGAADASRQRFSDPDTLAPTYPTPQMVVDRMLTLRRSDQAKRFTTWAAAMAGS